MGTAPVPIPTGFLHALGASTSEDEALEALARWLPEIIPIKRLTIAVPLDGDRIEIRPVEGSEAVLSPGTIASSSVSLPGKAIASKRPEAVADLRDSDLAEAPKLLEAGVRSAMSVPLLSGNRCFATINIGNQEVGFFTDNYVGQLSSLTSLVAAYLDAHRLAESEAKRADTDHLTQCLSRAAVLDALDELFNAISDQSDLAILYLDCDKFKAINDTHGHSAGDSVLKVLAQRIQGLIRPQDELGRLGGDEFLVITERSQSEAAALAARIAETCTMPIRLGAIKLNPEVSIGVACPTDHTTSSLDLLHDADQAMYAAKREGSKVSVADDMIRSHAAMVSTIDRDLDGGLERDGMTLHLQPVYAMRSGRIVGAEALTRWAHPELGPIPADLLVERLITTGRTEKFTRWTLETACRMWSEVRAQVPWLAEFPIAINLTPRQLAWTGYPDFHAHTTAEHGLRQSDVFVEVVENGAIDAGDAAEQTLKRLAAQGVSISLDDFGVGYNALGYFARFPIHTVKFDRSLVNVVVDVPDMRALLAGLTSVIHDLGAFTVAEGVETEVEAEICRDLGIAMGQGWHLGYPVAVDTFVARTLTQGPPNSHGAVDAKKLRAAQPRELFRWAPEGEHASPTQREQRL